MSTTTPASPFCVQCYLSGIERLCGGFTITYSTGKKVIAVPGLEVTMGKNMAADVRKAARAHIERHGPGDTRHHPLHAGRQR